MTPRAILRVDSLFEVVLGLLLVAAAAASVLGPSDFPSPVGTTLVASVGCALLPVGVLLWRLSRGPVPYRLLRVLATANLATVSAALAWRWTATGFSSAGSAFTIVAAAVLAALAAAQLYASARIRQRSRRARSPKRQAAGA